MAQPVSIITGASTGLGAALALELASRGHAVGLIARRPELLAALTAKIEAAGGKAAYAAADVTDRRDIGEAVAILERTLGPCTLFVANAGVGGPTPAHKANFDEIGRIVKVNIDGVLHSIEAVLPGMVARGSGHIAAVSSVAGFRGLPGTAAYSASKSFVTTFLESFRVDLQKRGIAVTAIHPGFVETPLTAKNRFSMPFLMKSDRAARIMADGLERRKSEITFPWQMYLLMHFARLVPNWLYDLAIGRASPMK